jgi:hypothetical protein
MKQIEFRKATIVPLIRFGIYIANMSTDDNMEHFALYYRMDDFGNPYQIKPFLIYTGGYLLPLSENGLH